MNKVININEFRIKKTNSKKIALSCQHINLTLDDNGGIVKCDDCGLYLDPFSALSLFIDKIDEIQQKIESDRVKNSNDKNANLYSRAAKKLDDIWRRQGMSPVCPHCNSAILPEDNFGSGAMSTEFVRSLRLNKLKNSP